MGKSGSEYAALLQAMFRLTEYLIDFELGNRARRLVVHYLNESRKPDLTGRAREAVGRYTQLDFPGIAEIKEKSRRELCTVDHLVLQMEYEARQLSALHPVILHFELPG